MNIHDLLHPQNLILYEVPDPAGGGGAAGAVADPSVQPPEGQGDPGTTPQPDQFWGLFPDVPEEMRAQLEPHLKTVQGHVTKLQQQLAPFKSFVDRGYDPQQIQGLFTFSENFDRDPLSTWLQIGQLLQQPDPTTGKSTIHEDLDLEILHKVATGQEIDDDPTAAAQTAGQLPTGAEGANLPPEVTQLIQDLRQKVETLESGFNDEKVQRQSATQQRLLKGAVENIRTTLKEAGYTDDQLAQHVPEETIRAMLVSTNGNAAQAAQRLVDLRSGILSSIVDTGGQPKPLDTSGGVPKPKTPPTRNPRDGFEASRPGATDFLRRQNRAAAQG